ncbi:MAG: 2-hydroxyacid dehydrogenase [Candidatus Helarchaeales archaeon]
MKIIWCGSGWKSAAEKFKARLKQELPECTLIFHDINRPLTEQVADVDVLIPTMEKIDAKIMDAAPKLKLIHQFGVGLEGVDFAAAEKRNITIANTPGTNHQSVAEAALFLMLALAKRWKEAEQAFKEKKLGWPVGTELENKILGIIGLGQSGKDLARRAAAFEMRIMAIKRKLIKIEKYDFKLAFLGEKGDLDYILEHSDFVSIHAPLTEETEGLFGEREFQLMKPTAFIINVARGPIIQKPALLKALKEKWITGAGLDVFWNEPENPEDPLFQENVIALPHVAGSTTESHDRIINKIIENLKRLKDGKPLNNVQSGK